MLLKRLDFIVTALLSDGMFSEHLSAKYMTIYIKVATGEMTLCIQSGVNSSTNKRRTDQHSINTTHLYTKEAILYEWIYRI